MAKAEQEIEVKFFVRSLPALTERLQALQARLDSERILEVNLRFDTPDKALSRKQQVLRLRQDNAAVLTFKGQAKAKESVSVRQEIEFKVSDFDAARHFLEALGYQVAIIYEKYRTTYTLNGLMITLDEMPFGDFMEIEGPDAESIQQAARQLHLDWQARSTASYLFLFNQFCQARGLSFDNLTFAEVQGVKATPEDLNMAYADANQAGQS